MKFHHERTSASLKSNLTKIFNLSGTELRTNRPETFMPLKFHMPGHKKDDEIKFLYTIQIFRHIVNFTYDIVTDDRIVAGVFVVG